MGCIPPGLRKKWHACWRCAAGPESIYQHPEESQEPWSGSVKIDAEIIKWHLKATERISFFYIRKQSHVSSVNEYGENREKKEFWFHLWEEINSWDQENIRDNERKVLEAIKVLLENSDDIEIFNKKAVYLYLRELTGLNTKQVVNNLNKLRVKYFKFTKKWNNGKI